MTEFKKFIVGDLFEVVSAKGSDKGSIINFSEKKKQYYVEFIGRSSENYGLQGYAPKNNLHINPANSISISQIGTICALYRKNEWVASQNMFCIKLPEDCSEKSALYLITVIRKSILSRFSNGYTQYPTLKDISYGDIELPVTIDGSPDWKEMESVVDTVEQQHVDTIDKTLSAAGFSSFEDTLLTSEEESLLKEWLVAQTKSERSASAPVPSKLRMDMVKLGDLFEIKTVVGVNINDLCKGNSVNYVTRTSSNRGVHSKVGFTKFAHLIPNNTFSLGLLQMDTFYQANPYYVGQFVRYILPKFDLNLNVALYFETIFNSMKDLLLAGSVSDVNELFLNHAVLIPTDFEVIDSLGIILKKLAIRDLRQSLDEQLSKYQSLKNL